MDRYRTILWFTTLWLFCLFLFLGAGIGKAAASSFDEADQIQRQAVRLIQDLDSEEYAVRQAAVGKLNRLVTQTNYGDLLAAVFDRVLVTGNTSFEVRRHLETLRRELPKRPLASVDTVPAEEIVQLITQLEAADYGARLSAGKRLEWLLGNPKLVGPVFDGLRQRLDRESLAADATQWLQPLYVRAHEARLLDPSFSCTLPVVPEEKIAGWIDELARSADSERTASQERAARALGDVLVRETYVPKIRQLLQARLARGELPPEATLRLQELLDLTVPRMTAEFWTARRLEGVQRLVVNVPQWGAGAQRPSHFSRIDDKLAHCESGQNLATGDYPVGVAFPHPKEPNFIIQLVNLTSPRQKILYAYLERGPQKRRFIELSRRTVDAFLARKQPLAITDLRVLWQLDPAEMSRFAGRFFAVGESFTSKENSEESISSPLRVDDLSLNYEFVRLTGGAADPEILLCAFLAAGGTREAIPGLLGALGRGRITPRSNAPCQLPWIAALAIAGRDPWPGVDAWLAQQLSRTEPLVRREEQGPELAATAAGLLLVRQKLSVDNFGLVMADHPILRSAGLCGYRFTSPESREKVLRWWNRRQSQAAPAGRPG